MSIRIVNDGTSSMVIRGPHPSEIWMDYALTPVRTVLSAQSSEDIVIDDLNVRVDYVADVLVEGQLNVYNTIPIDAGIPTFVSLDTDIGTVNSDGYVTRVTTGTARILMSAYRITKRADVPVYLEDGGTEETPLSFVSGSLGYNISNNVDSRIVGITPETATAKKPIYSVQDHTGSSHGGVPTYVRSTDCWAYGLDLTCMSPWNSYSGIYRAGTLISPRHYMLANHYVIPNGYTLRFITQDNVVIDRTIVNSLHVGTNDTRIGVLDSDVPETVTFAKVLPDNWIDYIPSIAFAVPTLYTDQQEKALVSHLDKDLSASLIWFSVPAETYTSRLALYETVVGGDSGNPIFLIINNELVLLTCWYYGGSGGGPNILTNKAAINAAMTTLGGGYQLTEIDLSEFPIYS